MARVPDDHLIQACAANTPEAPLDGGVLPRVVSQFPFEAIYGMISLGDSG
jgi:hypothetical protein